ncbi:hypothetical protein HNQ88_002505 [Aureibacter tunicatorum]|uniref:Uncharacterized protein n=1 Tax=Aureibacter tunicatorum TaxID=866807 RepID=A0AAE3XP00_9BACT|nr:hypothetical protein [Aureibacter tunicatorum]BDD04610.1 hypothetical protein AUTU_20930 [Aureibacter tunicatorum]
MLLNNRWHTFYQRLFKSTNLARLVDFYHKNDKYPTI